MRLARPSNLPSLAHTHRRQLIIAEAADTSAADTRLAGTAELEAFPEAWSDKRPAGVEDTAVDRSRSQPRTAVVMVSAGAPGDHIPEAGTGAGRRTADTVERRAAPRAAWGRAGRSFRRWPRVCTRSYS